MEQIQDTDYESEPLRVGICLIVHVKHFITLFNKRKSNANVADKLEKKYGESQLAKARAKAHCGSTVLFT